MALLMIDIAGTELTNDDVQLLQNPAIAGLIFFSRNFESIPQFERLVKAVLSVNPDLLLAIDQEGGRVQRIKSQVTRLPPMRDIFNKAEGDIQKAIGLAKDIGWLMASEMCALGLDISFAPVLDLDFQRCAVIGDRAFHSEPDKVTILVSAFISGLHQAGMSATGKHFPGHGYVLGDSHVDIPVDERSWQEIASQDLKPYHALLTQLSGIMPAHVIYSAMDKQPAGFSVFWLQKVLRGDLGYDGVIFSDDLTMEGASVAGDFIQRAEAAVVAGCDMLLICNNRDAVLQTLTCVENLDIANQDAKRRILQMKKKHSPFGSLAELVNDDKYQYVRQHIEQVWPAL